MTAVQHVYVTAHGEWTYAEWVGEFAQIGLRMCFAKATDVPEHGAVFTPLANGDVAPLTGTTSGPHGVLTNTFTFRVGEVGSTENFDGGAQVNAAEDMWTFLDAIKGNFVAGFRWTHIKIAPILADGRYGAPSAVYTLSAPLAGTAAGGAGTVLPPECALAVSLRAPVLGRRGRGRVYLPGLAAGALTASGTVATAQNNAIRAAFKTLVTNLEDMAAGVTDHDGVVVVTSAGKSTAVRPLEVRIGSHLDVQRRRQTNVPEVYLATVL